MSKVSDYSKFHTVRNLIDNSAETYGKKPFIKYLVDDEIIEKSFCFVYVCCNVMRLYSVWHYFRVGR